MTKKTTKADKTEAAAAGHFNSHENTHELAVIDKGEVEAQITIFCRTRGKQWSIGFPLTYDLEFAAQQLLRRIDSVRGAVIYL